MPVIRSKDFSLFDVGLPSNDRCKDRGSLRFSLVSVLKSYLVEPSFWRGPVSYYPFGITIIIAEILGDPGLRSDAMVRGYF